jgi:DMSO/TMAO reductase YedYZ molybdopterin-dependent catalytic subunit
LRHVGAAFATITGALPRGRAATLDQPFANGTRELVAYPQKRPLMRITARPPHLEAPFSVFSEAAFAPNDAFFVRYHLANIPLSIDVDTYRLNVRGKVDRELWLSLKDLRSLAAPVEVTAVNQSAGNSRGFSMPRVFSDCDGVRRRAFDGRAYTTRRLGRIYAYHYAGPGMSVTQWTAEVTKNQHVGAPIEDSEIEPLAIYLASAYAGDAK